MSARYPWSVLGLDGPADIKEIRRAYAKRLREIDRDDAVIFQNLINARDFALKQAKTKTARPSLQNIADMNLAAPRIAVKEPDIPAPNIIVQKQKQSNPNFPPNGEIPMPQLWAKSTKTLVEEIKEQIDSKNWKTVADKFKDDDISITLKERIEIELYLYQYFLNFNEISQVVQASSSKLDVRQAALFEIVEGEFKWLSDNLSASKRLGVHKFDAGILAEIRNLRLRHLGRYVPSKSTSSGSGFSWWYLLIVYFIIRAILKIIENFG